MLSLTLSRARGALLRAETAAARCLATAAAQQASAPAATPAAKPASAPKAPKAPKGFVGFDAAIKELEARATSDRNTPVTAGPLLAALADSPSGAAGAEKVRTALRAAHKAGVVLGDAHATTVVSKLALVEGATAEDFNAALAVATDASLRLPAGSGTFAVLFRGATLVRSAEALRAAHAAARSKHIPTSSAYTAALTRAAVVVGDARLAVKAVQERLASPSKREGKGEGAIALNNTDRYAVHQVLAAVKAGKLALDALSPAQLQWLAGSLLPAAKAAPKLAELAAAVEGTVAEASAKAAAAKAKGEGAGKEGEGEGEKPAAAAGDKPAAEEAKGADSK